MYLLTQILDIILPTKPPLDRTLSIANIQAILHSKPSPSRTPAPWITSGFPYRDPEVRRLVLHLKRYNDRPLAAALTRRLCDTLSELESDFYAMHGCRTTALVPVPLHISQLRKRGFNQSELIARSLAREHPHRKVYTGLIASLRHTRKQALLSREARYRNMVNTLARTHKKLPDHALVVLIDDVTTTGATLQEARLQFSSEVPPHRLLALTIAH